MIETQQLTEAERDELSREARSSFAAVPLVMVLVFLVMTLVLGMPWSVFWGCTIFVVLLFFILYQDFGREKIDKDIEDGIKLVRRGKVFEVDRQVGYATGQKFVDIKLEKEPVPEPYPETHHFSIYNSLVQLYHKPDDSLPQRYKELKGKTVLIEYFPYSGHVLSFEEEGK